MAGGTLGLAVVFAVLWFRERARRKAVKGADKTTSRETSMLTPAAVRSVLDQLGGDTLLAKEIFASSPDAILVMDPFDEREPMAIVVCSESVATWHGWTREELMGRSINLIEQDSATWTLDAAMALVGRLRKEGSVRGEAGHRRKDGSVFPVEFINSLLVLGGREYVLGFDRDITGRRLAEEALRASEQRFRAIIDASPLSIWLLDPHDPNVPRRIVDANEYGAKMHGVTRDELIGRSINDFDAEAISYEQEQVRLAWMKQNPGLSYGEAVHKRSDGSLFPIRFVSTPLIIGGQELILGIDEDITERKQAEAALRASEEKYRVIMDACPIAVMLQDPYDPEVPMRLIDVNRHAAEMHGITVEEMVGRGMSDFDVFQFTHERVRLLLEIIRGKGTLHGEAIHRRVDGTRFPIEFVCTLVVIGGREFILGIDRDVTERKRIDAELNDSRRLRAVGAMVGGVAHEFNNLLTPMLLHLEILGYENVNDPRLAARIGPIRLGIDRARELTRRILTFGVRTIDTREFLHVEEVLRENLDLFSRTIDRRIQIVVHPTIDPVVVWANRSDLNQLLVNLILNARDTLLEKATKAAHDADWKPKLEIGIESIMRTSGVQNDADQHTVRCWHCLIVRDNGLGMSDEVRDRAFEPFFTTKAVGQGTGLGLATVWHVTSALGGWIEIQSRQDEGTTFTIFLPAAANNEPILPGLIALGADTMPKAEPTPLTKNPRRRVLLVEDDELVAFATRLMIESFGHQVDLFADGNAAWENLAARSAEYDVVLTDLNLPGINGVELVRRLRTLNYAGRIMVYSGYFSREHHAELQALKADHLLSKPFTREELVVLLG